MSIMLALETTKVAADRKFSEFKPRFVALARRTKLGIEQRGSGPVEKVSLPSTVFKCYKFT